MICAKQIKQEPEILNMANSFGGLRSSVRDESVQDSDVTNDFKDELSDGVSGLIDNKDIPNASEHEHDEESKSPILSILSSRIKTEDFQGDKSKQRSVIVNNIPHMDEKNKSTASKSTSERTNVKSEKIGHNTDSMDRSSSGEVVDSIIGASSHYSDFSGETKSSKEQEIRHAQKKRNANDAEDGNATEAKKCKQSNTRLPRSIRRRLYLRNRPELRKLASRKQWNKGGQTSETPRVQRERQQLLINQRNQRAFHTQPQPPAMESQLGPRTIRAPLDQQAIRPLSDQQPMRRPPDDQVRRPPSVQQCFRFQPRVQMPTPRMEPQQAQFPFEQQRVGGNPQRLSFVSEHPWERRSDYHQPSPPLREENQGRWNYYGHFQHSRARTQDGARQPPTPGRQPYQKIINYNYFSYNQWIFHD